MNGRAFTRRRLLQLAGTSVAVGVSGCLASDDDSSDTSGYAPKTANSTTTNGGMTAQRIANESSTPVDESSFKTLPTSNGTVPLVPINVAYDWYRNRKARFADARGQTAYKKSHIAGAALSPAKTGQSNDDPVESWPKSDRIVTYCGCPHHLSSLRAANLINQGYKKVYALDEGFWEWTDRNYPTTGSETNNQPKIRSITGATAPKFAGKTAWAFHPQSGQQEATGIEENGQYVLNLPFYDVTDSSIVKIKTPPYTIKKPLEKLTSLTITPSGSLSMNSQ